MRGDLQEFVLEWHSSNNITAIIIQKLDKDGPQTIAVFYIIHTNIYTHTNMLVSEQ